MKKLIKNGTIVTAEGEFKGDILIDGEVISEIGISLDCQADEAIDAAGKYVMPGGVDQHTHYLFGVPHVDSAGNPTNDLVGKTLEYTDVALIGGTTTIVEHTSNQPGMSIGETLEFKKEKCAKGIICCDYSMHANPTEFPEDIYEQIAKLPEHGVASLKLYTAYKHTCYYVDDEQMFRFMEVCRDNGITLYVHCENGDLVYYLRNKAAEEGHLEPKYHITTRPSYVEIESVQRVITLAKATGCPVCIVHVTCKEALDLIHQAQSEGAGIITEVCPEHLFKDRSFIEDPPFEKAVKSIVSPASRSKHHLDYLWKGIRRGWIDIYASDHSPTKMVDKERGRGDFRTIPNGAPAIGDRINLMWTFGVAEKRISRSKLVDLCCTQPAKAVGLYPKKGTLTVGSDADILIYDPDWEGVITNEEFPSGIDFNAFEGFKQIGRVDTVFLRGNKMVEGHRYVGPRGIGEFVPAKPYGLAFERMEDDWRFED